MKMFKHSQQTSPCRGVVHARLLFIHIVGALEHGGWWIGFGFGFGIGIDVSGTVLGSICRLVLLKIKWDKIKNTPPQTSTRAAI